MLLYLDVIIQNIYVALGYSFLLSLHIYVLLFISNDYLYHYLNDYLYHYLNDYLYHYQN